MSKVSPRLVSCLAYWVKRLNLTDWAFSLEKASQEDLDEKDSMAYCQINQQHKSAEIFLADLQKFDEDVEFCIVHELLHVVYWHISTHHYRDKFDVDLFEQALNTTTKALLSSK